MSVEMVRLGDICDIRSGGTPSRTVLENYGGKIPWAKIADLNVEGDTVLSTSENITEQGLKAIRGRIFKSGTLLFAMYGSVGKTAFAGVDMSTNQAILGISPKPNAKIDLRYLNAYLKSQGQKLNDMAVGVTQKNLSATVVKDLLIPLPSLERQREIAAVLDKVDELRQKRRQSISKLEELLQSTFLEMFGDPVENPKGWEVRKLGEALIDIKAGVSYGGEQRPLSDNELGVLKVSAVTSGKFNPREFKAVPKSEIRKTIIQPKKGDLLMTRANTRELVGATCLVSKDYADLFLPDKVWRIDLNSQFLRAWYLKFVLSDKKIRTSLTDYATGTSGSMLNISKDKVRALEIPMPSLDEQDKFQILANEVEEHLEEMLTHLSHLDDLYASLQAQFFGAGA